MPNILFLCSKNKLRSPTAEAIFCEVDGWDVYSAGISNDAEVHVALEDIEWADYIFVMEGKTKMTPILKFVFFVFFTNFQLVQNIIRVSHGNCKKASSKFG